MASIESLLPEEKTVLKEKDKIDKHQYMKTKL